MDALKEKLAIALSWFGVFWFVIFTIVSFPSFGTVIFLVGLAICLPIPAIRDFWDEKGLRGAAKISLIAALVVAGAAMTPREKTEPSKEAETLSDAAVAEAQEPAPEENGVEAQEETQSEAMPPDGAITLVAGEKGEYGKWAEMNKETFYAYYLPGGVYSVTNAGAYPAQVNVYAGIRRNWEAELDEYTDTGDVLRLDVGDSGEITVPDGWFIELHEPDKVWLVRTGDAPEAVEPEIVEPVSEPKPAPEPVSEPDPAPEKVDASLDDCIGLIKTALENSFENCDVYLHDSGHVLSIDVWRDGLTQTAFLAYGGNQEALDSSKHCAAETPPFRAGEEPRFSLLKKFCIFAKMLDFQ